MDELLRHNQLGRELIIIAYELSTVFAGLVLALLLIRIFSRKSNSTLRHYVLVFLFAVYFCAVLTVTGSGTVFDLTNLTAIEAANINIIPFYEEAWFMQYVLNVIMLVPLGFMLPAIWKKADKLVVVTLFGFCFSLAIELSQLLNYRISDTDDLIMNTFGAIVGFLLFRLFFRRSDKIDKRPERNSLEPFLCISFMFLGHFFLFNSYGALNLLY